MKKVLYLIFSFVVLFALTGCGGSSVEKALGKLQGYDNYIIKMNMEMEAKTVESANLSMEIVISQYNENKIKMVTSMDMGYDSADGFISIDDLEMYYEKTGDKLYLYTENYYTGEFTKEEVDTSEQEDLMTTSQLDSMLTDLGDIKDLGKKTIDGTECIKYEVDLDIEKLKENEMFTSTLEETGEALDEELLNKIHMYLYIDTKKDEFKRLEMDFIDYMAAYIEKYGEDQDISGEFSKFNMYFDLESVGTVKDFNFPSVD